MVSPANPLGIVLFGAGAGGDPRRYSALLDAFAAAGFVVIAPPGERFSPQTVTTTQLQARVDDLRNALADNPDCDLPVSVVGHSVGGWAALCLAGAHPWGRDGKPISVNNEPRVTRLVLFAPTVGWFQAPAALNDVTAPITVHVGAADIITPPATAEVLRTSPAATSITVHPDVGHYDFMSVLPPTIKPTPGLDHHAFLGKLAASTVQALR
jgi:alpha-beta hydrolase superfamily lysophospholipase